MLLMALHGHAIKLKLDCEELKIRYFHCGSTRYYYKAFTVKATTNLSVVPNENNQRIKAIKA